ncbi:MAG: glucose-6-phosphate dehydrogenase [Sandaracinaceae bacterium]
MARAQVVIFGGGGDLARRKLLPALARIADRGRELSVVGVGRRDNTDEAYRAQMREAVGEADRAAFDALAPHVSYRSADVEDRASLDRLRQDLDRLGDAEGGRLVYLALKPSLFASAVERLAAAAIVERQDDGDPAYRRVVIEKPFGHDLGSAQALNEALHAHLAERQLFRIDHYLGKETVQNLLGFRFHNAIFEPLWNRHHVELVQVTVAEAVGMPSGRGAYYDTTGALRDMLQNHMLQILALVAMEPPPSLEPEAVRNQKVEVLRALSLPDPEDVARFTVRARYASGSVEGDAVPAYLEEEGVPAGSDTETYVAVRAEIDNWRWAGVPFLLRHGKRLPKRFTEVQVQFRTPPIQLFNRPEGMSDAELRRHLREGTLCLIRPNVLTIGIQPKESISISFGVKQPGSEMVMAPATLSFDYQGRFGAPTAPAYQRLLADALAGDPTLFLRADEIEASWRFADSVRTVWRSPAAPPLLEYDAGSWGPEEATDLFIGCEGGWTRGRE